MKRKTDRGGESGIRDEKESERGRMTRGGMGGEAEKKERTGPAAVCLAGIIFQQSLILSIKAVGLLFFFFPPATCPPLFLSE